MFDRPAFHLLDAGETPDFFEGASETELNEHLQLLKSTRSRIDAIEARVLVAIRRLHQQDTPAARLSDVADNLTEGVGESRSEARRKTRRAELIDRHAAIATALLAGTITAGHADALSALPAKYYDDLGRDLVDLLQRAAQQGVDDFSESVRRWREHQDARSGEDFHKSRRDRRTLSFRRDRFSGMTRFGGLLDPESAARARSLLAQIEQAMLRSDQAEASEDPGFTMRTSGQRLADALVHVCDLARGAKAGAGQAAEPTVIVTIPLEHLQSGNGDGEALGGGAVAAETVRRLACEGGLLPAVLGSEGQVLDLGRRTRLATSAQRLALRARYDGCAVPACDAPFEWCHMHHIDHWEAGGRTDLSNLVPVCTRHHGQIHDGRLRLCREPDGTDHWTRPRLGTDIGRDGPGRQRCPASANSCGRDLRPSDQDLRRRAASLSMVMASSDDCLSASRK